MKRSQFVPEATAKDGYAVPPRGGSFAEWLVERLMATIPARTASCAGKCARRLLQGGDQGPNVLALPVPAGSLSPTADDRLADAAFQHER